MTSRPDLSGLTIVSEPSWWTRGDTPGWAQALALKARGGWELVVTQRNRVGLMTVIEDGEFVTYGFKNGKQTGRWNGGPP